MVWFPRPMMIMWRTTLRKVWCILLWVKCKQLTPKIDPKMFSLEQQFGSTTTGCGLQIVNNWLVCLTDWFVNDNHVDNSLKEGLVYVYFVPSMERVLVYLSLTCPEIVEGTCDQQKCAGWSESSLVAQVLLWGLSCAGLYVMGIY